MPFLVKPMLLEWIVSIISLMIIFAIDTFEGICTRFFFQSFESQRVCFKVSFAISCYFSVVFKFVWPITFLTLGSMYMVHISSISLFLAVLTLWYAGVHVHPSDSRNVTTYIKAPVNKALHFYTILQIPNINPDYSYVRLWICLDNPGL